METSNFQNKDASVCYFFFERGKDTTVFLFCRITYCPQSYFERFWWEPRTGCGSTWRAQLASEILEVAYSIHYCFHCTFSQFKAECVSMHPESFSVCLIMARGCSSVQTTHPFKHTSNPPAGHRFLSVFETQAVGGFRQSSGSLFTLIQNEKLPTK